MEVTIRKWLLNRGDRKSEARNSEIPLYYGMCDTYIVND